MRWLTKILKGSSHRISKGQYHGKYEDDTIWEGPPASAVIIIVFDCYLIPIICISKRSLHHLIGLHLQDQLSDFDKEELDRAIALSISEAEDKGKKVVGKSRGCKLWS